MKDDLVIRFLFPIITDERSARKAAFQGAIAAWFFACSTVFRAATRITYSESQELNFEVYGPIIFLITAAQVYLGYKAFRMSRVAASIIFAIQFSEIGARIYLGSIGFGLFVAVVMFLFAINGIRGANAYNKLTA